jgi:hypothetical protein
MIEFKTTVNLSLLFKKSVSALISPDQHKTQLAGRSFLRNVKNRLPSGEGWLMTSRGWALAD